MSVGAFAVRKDGRGWRAVDDVNDITADEVFSNAAPHALALAPGELILAQIAEFEATVTARQLREAALGTDDGQLAAIDAQIAALRAQLPAG